jgi:plastocyanin
MNRIARMVMVAALMLGWLVPTPAAAGGGCHGMSLTDQATNEIKTADACFVPTVARVEPGAKVTFFGEYMEHNVTGVPTSFNALQSRHVLGDGSTLSFRFDKPGTYPYVCTLHPMMAGVIVVGDGIPEGGEDAAIAPPPAGGGDDTAAQDQPVTAPATEPVATRSGWIVGGALAAALAVTGLLALFLQRGGARRRRVAQANLG